MFQGEIGTASTFSVEISVYTVNVLSALFTRKKGLIGVCTDLVFVCDRMASNRKEHATTHDIECLCIDSDLAIGIQSVSRGHHQPVSDDLAEYKSDRGLD